MFSFQWMLVSLFHSKPDICFFSLFKQKCSQVTMEDNIMFQRALVIYLILSERNAFWKACAHWVSAWQALVDLDVPVSND